MAACVQNGTVTHHKHTGVHPSSSQTHAPTQSEGPAKVSSSATVSTFSACVTRIAAPPPVRPPAHTHNEQPHTCINMRGTLPLPSWQLKVMRAVMMEACMPNTHVGERKCRSIHTRAVHNSNIILHLEARRTRRPSVFADPVVVANTVRAHETVFDPEHARLVPLCLQRFDLLAHRYHRPFG